MSRYDHMGHDTRCCSFLAGDGVSARGECPGCDDIHAQEAAEARQRHEDDGYDEGMRRAKGEV